MHLLFGKRCIFVCNFINKVPKPAFKLLNIMILTRILTVLCLLFSLAVPMQAKTKAGKLEASNYTYTGGVKNGKQHGWGICRYKNGNAYYGFWDHGYKHGLGRIVYADGTMDLGYWKKGIFAKQKKRRFKPGKQVYGIDVSKYQKRINWEKLALKASATGSVGGSTAKGAYVQPVLFAIMKSTEGTTIVDPTFDYNFKEAKRVGIVRGAYHFLSVSSSVEDQVEFYIKNTPLERGDLPPVLDLEIAASTMKAQHAKVCRMAKQWLKLVEKHYGVKPIIYTYNKYYLDYLKGHGFDDYDFWLARYGAKPSARHWEIWQVSDKGRAQGIAGPVDVDLFRGNYSEFKRFLAHKGIQ